MHAGEGIPPSNRAARSKRSSQTSPVQQANEAVLRQLLGSSPDTMGCQDIDLRYTLVVNPPAPYSEAQLLGKTDFDLFPPYEAKRVTETKRRVMETGAGARLETVLTVDGETRHYDAAVEPMRDSEGRVTGVIWYSHDITDRKRSEKAIANSEEKFRLIGTHSPDFIFYQDLDFRYIWVLNPPAPLSEGDLLGKTTHEVFPDAAGQLTDMKRTVIGTGRGVRLETSLRVGDNVCVYDAHYEPRRGENGEIVGVFGYLRDVTDYKNAEQALEFSLRRFRTLANEVPVGIFETDARGNLLFSNERWAQITGLRAGDAAGTDWARAIHPDDRERVLDLTLEAGREGSQFSVEYRSLSPDGRTSWVIGSAAPVFDEEGRLARYLGTITDVTELKRAQEATARLAAIIESSEEAILGITLDGTITSWNPGAERLYGYAVEEMVGTPMELLSPPDRLGETASILERVGHGEVVQHFDTVRLRKDGTAVDVSMSVAPVRDAGGRVVGGAAVARDITERIKAERFRREYVWLVSHDLRAPLTVVLGMADVLRRRLEERGIPTEQKAVDAILEAGRRMNAMLEDLVESALLESGSLHLVMERVDLPSFIADITARLSGASGQPRVRLSVPTDLPEVRVDRGRLERAITNLITNALKYSPEDTPVRVSVRKLKRLVTVCVSDKGAGIPPEDLPQLFERFYRAKGAGKAEGLGLGLYIARMVINAHGGEIWVKSEEGKGSTFCFSLPLQTGFPG